MLQNCLYRRHGFSLELQVIHSPIGACSQLHMVTFPTTDTSYTVVLAGLNDLSIRDATYFCLDLCRALSCSGLDSNLVALLQHLVDGPGSILKCEIYWFQRWKPTKNCVTLLVLRRNRCNNVSLNWMENSDTPLNASLMCQAPESLWGLASRFPEAYQDFQLASQFLAHLNNIISLV